MKEQNTNLNFAQSSEREEDYQHWGVLNFGVTENSIPDVNATLAVSIPFNAKISCKFSFNIVRVELTLSTIIYASQDRGFAEFIAIGAKVEGETAQFARKAVVAGSDLSDSVQAIFVNERCLGQFTKTQVFDTAESSSTIYGKYHEQREHGRLDSRWIVSFTEHSGKVSTAIKLDHEHGKPVNDGVNSLSEHMYRLFDTMLVQSDIAKVSKKQGQVRTNTAQPILVTAPVNSEQGRWLYYGKNPNSQSDGVEQPQEYQGDGTLNFECLWYRESGLLNFGVVCQWQDDTLIYDGVVFVHNEISLTRLDTGESIKMFSGDISIDESSYMWSFNADVAFDTLLERGVLVSLEINGHQWRLITDDVVPSEEFNNRTVKISGKSQSLVLGYPFVSHRGHKYTDTLYSSQIAQAEIDRVNGFELDWQLVDSLGWQVPANTYSYTHYTPINALVDIAESGGGFINSHATKKQLIVKSHFPTPSWEWDGLTPDVEIVPSLIWSASASKTERPSYNGVWVSGERNGVLGNITRLGTDGATLANQVIHPLITKQSVAIHRGKGELSKAGITYHNTIVTPLHSDIGLLEPSDYVTLLGSVGIVRAVNIHFDVDERGAVGVENRLSIDTVRKVVV